MNTVIAATAVMTMMVMMTMVRMMITITMTKIKMMTKNTTCITRKTIAKLGVKKTLCDNDDHDDNLEN